MAQEIAKFNFTIKRINKGLKRFMSKSRERMNFTIKRINKGLKPLQLSAF